MNGDVFPTKIRRDKLVEVVYYWLDRVSDDPELEAKLAELQKVAYELIRSEASRPFNRKNFLNDEWITKNHRKWAGVNLVLEERKKPATEMQFSMNVLSRLSEIQALDHKLAEAITKLNIKPEELPLLMQLQQLTKGYNREEAITHFIERYETYSSQLEKFGDEKLKAAISGILKNVVDMEFRLAKEKPFIKSFLDQLKGMVEAGLSPINLRSYVAMIYQLRYHLGTIYRDNKLVKRMDESEPLRRLTYLLEERGYFSMQRYRDRKNAEKEGLQFRFYKSEQTYGWDYFLKRFFPKRKEEFKKIIKDFGDREAVDELKGLKKDQAIEDWIRKCGEIERGLYNNGKVGGIIGEGINVLIEILERRVKEIETDVDSRMQEAFRKIRPRLEKRKGEIENGAKRIMKSADERKKRLGKVLARARKMYNSKEKKIFGKDFYEVVKMIVELKEHYDLSTPMGVISKIAEASPAWYDYLENSTNRINGSIGSAIGNTIGCILGCEQVASLYDEMLVQLLRSCQRIVHAKESGRLDKAIVLGGEFNAKLVDLMKFLADNGIEIKWANIPQLIRKPNQNEVKTNAN